MELAIDTSTAISSIALSKEGEIIAELTWKAGQQHSQELLPNIVHLLKQAKGDIHSLKAIIVAKGPGQFNGIRVGMAVAKGLAFSLSIPIVGISTLEVEAFPYSQSGLPVCPIHPIGGEIAFALFQMKEWVWQRIYPEQIIPMEDLISIIKEKTVFCGEITSAIYSYLKEKLGEKAVFGFSALNLRRAGYLAGLGWERLKRGEIDDPATLQPLYLRRPSITLSKKLGGQYAPGNQ